MFTFGWSDGSSIACDDKKCVIVNRHLYGTVKESVAYDSKTVAATLSIQIHSLVTFSTHKIFLQQTWFTLKTESGIVWLAVSSLLDFGILPLPLMIILDGLLSPSS